MPLCLMTLEHFPPSIVGTLDIFDCSKAFLLVFAEHLTFILRQQQARIFQDPPKCLHVFHVRGQESKQGTRPGPLHFIQNIAAMPFGLELAILVFVVLLASGFLA